MKCAYNMERNCGPDCAAYSMVKLKRNPPRHKEKIKKEQESILFKEDQETFYTDPTFDDITRPYCKRLKNWILD